MVEPVFTQTLIIHVISTNKIPFIESRVRWPLLVSSLVIAAVAALLTISPLASDLGFVPLPGLYWVFLLLLMMGSYILLTQWVKSWFIHKFGD